MQMLFFFSLIAYFYFLIGVIDVLKVREYCVTQARSLH